MDKNFTLINDDSLNFIKTIPANSIDLVLTDPPYGIEFQSHRRKEIYDKIKNDNSLEWLGNFFSECNRIMKDNTAIYCFCSWHNVDIFKKAFEKNFKLKNVLVWVKNNHGSGDLQASYAPKYEFILYGNKGRRKFTGKRMEDVFFANKTGNKLHPTEKPVDLLMSFILNSSNENDLVFDPFMGSGSTGEACMRTNRKFLGVELDENYYNTSKIRLNSINLSKP